MTIELSSINFCVAVSNQAAEIAKKAKKGSIQAGDLLLAIEQVKTKFMDTTDKKLQEAINRSYKDTNQEIASLVDIYKDAADSDTEIKRIPLGADAEAALRSLGKNLEFLAKDLPSATRIAVKLAGNHFTKHTGIKDTIKVYWDDFVTTISRLIHRLPEGEIQGVTNTIQKYQREVSEKINTSTKIGAEFMKEVRAKLDVMIKDLNEKHPKLPIKYKEDFKAALEAFFKDTSKVVEQPVSGQKKPEPTPPKPPVKQEVKISGHRPQVETPETKGLIGKSVPRPATPGSWVKATPVVLPEEKAVESAKPTPQQAPVEQPESGEKAVAGARPTPFDEPGGVEETPVGENPFAGVTTAEPKREAAKTEALESEKATAEPVSEKEPEKAAEEQPAKLVVTPPRANPPRAAKTAGEKKRTEQKQK